MGQALKHSGARFPDFASLLQLNLTELQIHLSDTDLAVYYKAYLKVLFLLSFCFFLFSNIDSAVNEAAKILRLLHLHELRDLQTQINKAIVLVQRQTANPKTDQSLGKVGR